MRHYFRAVAVDYDGTLTEGGPPAQAVLEAVRGLRRAGMKVLLVTGRILSELRAVFPEVDRYFDAIVAENGAVVARPGHEVRWLTDPVPAALEQALARRSVPIQRGEVLLAGSAPHDAIILEEIGRLGLECQIIRNRGALMILPAGISKGTGLFEALGELGISYHSTITIGDAENDHSLLDTSEIGVAVANAIDSLKAEADVVLSEPDGRGVAAFLAGPVAGGLVGVEPKRWQIELGAAEDGTPVTVPASRVNMLISGDTGVGKSYLAGLVAEQLLAMQYTLCILDLEGDHVGLRGLPGVMVMGGRDGLPPPAELEKLLRHRFGSLVIDLSLEDDGKRRSYSSAALSALERTRRDTGLPHWILLEEAHLSVGHGRARLQRFGPEETGLCLVTYRPDQLLAETVSSADIAISLAADGSALLRRHDQTEAEAQRFEVGRRSTAHVRHLHKYAQALLPRERRFYLRHRHGPTGLVAGNLAEFTAQLGSAPDAVLRHHAHGRDVSRWIADVFRDRRLAREVRGIEETIASLPETANLDEPRERIIRAIELRCGSRSA